MVSPIRKVVNKICMLRGAHGIVADRAQCKDLAGIRIRGILIRITMLKAKKNLKKTQSTLTAALNRIYLKKVAKFGVQLLLRRNKRYQYAIQDDWQISTYKVIHPQDG